MLRRQAPSGSHMPLSRQDYGFNGTWGDITSWFLQCWFFLCINSRWICNFCFSCPSMVLICYFTYTCFCFLCTWASQSTVNLSNSALLLEHSEFIRLSSAPWAIWAPGEYKVPHCLYWSWMGLWAWVEQVASLIWGLVVRGPELWSSSGYWDPNPAALGLLCVKLEETIACFSQAVLLGEFLHLSKPQFPTL